MKETKKIFIALVLVIILTIIFTILDSGLRIKQLNLLIQPLIFALVATISFLFGSYRKLLLFFSANLLSLMIITYLFNLLDAANWVGSLGFGILIIVFCSYIPVLIKRDHIEKF